MKNIKSRIIVITTAMLATACGVAGVGAVSAGSGSPFLATTSAAAQGAEQAAPSADDARAQELLNTTCIGCHDLSMVTNQPHAPGQWADILESMIGNGANLSDEDFKILDTYLEANYTTGAKS